MKMLDSLGTTSFTTKTVVTEACIYDMFIRRELTNGLFSNPYVLKNYGVITKYPLPDIYRGNAIISHPRERIYIVNETIDDYTTSNSQISSNMSASIPPKFSTSLNMLSRYLNAFADDQTKIQCFSEIYIQLVWVLKFFELYGVMHGDLHSGNIFVVRNVDNTSFFLDMGDGNTLVIKPKFYPVIYDFDRGFWSSDKKDTLVKSRAPTPNPECGFDSDVIENRLWRIKDSRKNSHGHIPGYDITRAFATAIPSPVDSDLTKLLVEAFFKGRVAGDVVGIRSQIREYENPKKLNPIGKSSEIIFYRLVDYYNSQAFSSGQPIQRIPNNQLASVIGLQKIKFGLLKKTPGDIADYFSAIPRLRRSIAEHYGLASPSPQARSQTPVASDGCVKLISDFQSGRTKILNPRTKRYVNRVDARGNPNKLLLPSFADCGYDPRQAPQQAPVPRRRVRIVRRGGSLVATNEMTRKCREFRQKYNNMSVEAVNPFTGRKIKILDDRRRYRAKGTEIFNQCAAHVNP
jgi:hypothetical protein